MRGASKWRPRPRPGPRSSTSWAPPRTSPSRNASRLGRIMGPASWWISSRWPTRWRGPSRGVGGAITKALDPEAATREIRRALDEGEVIPTTLFKRVGEEDIRQVLEMVSAANLSDALHRGGVLEGLRPLFPGIRMVGRAPTG